jgi:hypothetical protein
MVDNVKKKNSSAPFKFAYEDKSKNLDCRNQESQANKPNLSQAAKKDNDSQNTSPTESLFNSQILYANTPNENSQYSFKSFEEDSPHKIPTKTLNLSKQPTELLATPNPKDTANDINPKKP